MATVNLDKSEYDALVQSVEQARQETSKVRLELERERTHPVDARVAALTLYVEASKEVIDYAVGNLSPEFCVAWPAASLQVLADQITTVGNASQRDHERALIWRTFCVDILKYERERAARKVAGEIVTADDDPDIQRMYTRLNQRLVDGPMRRAADRSWIAIVAATVACVAVVVLARILLT